jgi:hypothetical protein
VDSKVATSEIKISVLIEEDETELAVRLLHTAMRKRLLAALPLEEHAGR